MSRLKKYWWIILLIIYFILMAFFISHIDFSKLIHKEKENVTDNITIVNMSDSSRIEQVSEDLLKQAVMIFGSKQETVTNEDGKLVSRTTTEDGSGVIIEMNDEVVYIMTNYHVINGMDKILITLNNDFSLDGTLIGYDEFYDIAILTVPNNPEMTPFIEKATIGNSDFVNLGEMVIAVGNALGHGQSITVGHISAKNREVAVTDGTRILFQTDAAINPGNSGGALVNLNGELIGINSSKYSEDKVERMSFAIPINDVLEKTSEIIKTELKSSNNIGELGIYGNEIDEDYQTLLNVESGIYITNLKDLSIAAQAGLEVGDILIKINDNPITSFDDLHKELKSSLSSEIKLGYLRETNQEWVEDSILVKFSK